MRLFSALPLDALAGFGRRRRTRTPRRRLPPPVARHQRQREKRLREENRRLRAELRAPVEPEYAPEPEPAWTESSEWTEPPWSANEPTDHLGRLPPVWGPPVAMGRNLRVQAVKGHRAAIVPLKDGLYLVAELPDSMAHPNFGVVPLLAPMMINAARKVLAPPSAPAAPTPVAPTAPLALPGPVAPSQPVLGWSEPVEVGCAHCRCRR